MALRKDIFRLFHEQKGLQYSIRIFLGTWALWFLSRILGDINPLWAIISFIIVTELTMEATWHCFKSRIMNTLVGCLTGIVFLLLLRHNEFVLPLALMTSVCISTYVIRIPFGWRIAAITATIVIVPSLMQGSKIVGMEVAFQRTAEVFFGSSTAVFVTWLFA